MKFSTIASSIFLFVTASVSSMSAENQLYYNRILAYNQEYNTQINALLAGSVGNPAAIAGLQQQLQANLAVTQAQIQQIPGYDAASPFASQMNILFLAYQKQIALLTTGGYDATMLQNWNTDLKNAAALW